MLFSRKYINTKTIAILVAIVFVVVAAYLIYAPVKAGDSQSIEVVIKNGQGVYSIAGILKEEGLIRSENIFVFYVHFAGDDRDLKAGKYLLNRSMSIPKIISIIANGLSESEDTIVTIPEGSNVWDIENILSKIAGVRGFAGRYYQEEGYLFPDTYRLANLNLPETDLSFEIEAKMKSNFNIKTAGVISPDRLREVIIIASILEKEAKSENDMKIIAGIINRRLEKGMPLEIDATVSYGACLRDSIANKFSKICDVSQANLIKEIKIDSPYNTYRRTGLPRGPISNPGIIAINSALRPQVTDYLYYLSTRDGSQIIYAKTPAEQAKNRKKYLGI